MDTSPPSSQPASRVGVSYDWRFKECCACSADVGSSVDEWSYCFFFEKRDRQSGLVERAASCILFFLRFVDIPLVEEPLVDVAGTCTYFHKKHTNMT